MRRRFFIYKLTAVGYFHSKKSENCKTGANSTEILREIFSENPKSAEFSMSKPFNRQFVKFWKGDEMKLLFSKKCWHTL